LWAQDQQAITLGKKDKLYSEILEEEREVWIYLPASFSPEAKYPVIYLLDGDIYFHSLAGMLQQLSSYGNTSCPEAILVGIPNVDRGRDLTPSDPQDGDQPQTAHRNFIQFLEKELIPYVEKKYKALPHRSLFGHSLGGTFVIQILLEKPDLFRNYLSMDPGLKFYEYRFRDQALRKLQQGKYPDQSLYVTVANTMPEGMDTLTALQDSTWVTSTIRTNLNFAKTLETYTGNQLDYQWRYFPDDNHLNVPHPSHYRALKYFFRWHPLDLDKTLRTNPDIRGAEFYQIITEHYQKVSQELNYLVLPPEIQVSDLGEYFYGLGDYEGAKKLYQLNLKNYPQNSDHAAALGDLFMETKEKEKALEFYQKAYKLDGNAYAKKKIEALQKN
ncbi:MAG: alpha/beta hydrolase-fold protein, partial [Bacteroidota bacterium]